MNNLTTWLGLGLAVAALVAVLLGLRVATVRKQRAAQDAARQLAEQRRQQAAHNQALALAQAQAEAQRLEAEAVALARQRAQAVLLAQRQAAAAEREARRRAADDAARQHAQELLDKRLAERAADAAARAAAAPPVAPRAAVPAPSAGRPTPAPAAPRTRAETVVLVADDSKVVRVKIGRLLEQHGFQVMLAEDGLAALRQMQLQVPHVLLTDAEMPGLDGLELTRKVRSLPHMAHVMVLMISSADGSLGEAARAAGVTALLGKPYAEDQLLAHLDRVRWPATAAT